MTQLNSHSSLVLSVLQHVPTDRLQKAINALAEGSMSVILTRTTETEIRALVRNGEKHEYSVTITEALTSCSCKNTLYRGGVCKHAVALALYAIRNPDAEQSKQPHSWHVGDRVERNGHRGTVICVSGEYVSIQWDTGRTFPTMQEELAAEA
jgi:uncharacterized Zn finger protein